MSLRTITPYPRPQFGQKPLALAAVILLLATVAQFYAAAPPQMVRNEAPAVAQGSDAAAKARVSEAYGELPLSFEAAPASGYPGQTDAQVKFLSRGNGYTLFLTGTGAVLSLSKPEPKSADGPEARQKTAASPADPAVLRMQLVGAQPNPRVQGTEELPGKVNYLQGNDPSTWRKNVPTYARVRYEGVYPGVDMVYYGNQRELEYDFVIAPGADPSGILLGFSGIETMKVDAGGNLVLRLRGGEEIVQSAPVAYQTVGGERRGVSSSYLLHDGKVGFHVGSYDRSLPLVIDPVLRYSTYLGGAMKDYGWDIAIDSNGSAYITGYTYSADFPVTAGSYDTTCGTAGVCNQENGANRADAFVSKLSAAGNVLLYSTFLGGKDDDSGYGIAVSGTTAYITGMTWSDNFPTTPGAYDRSYDAGPIFGPRSTDAFVTALDPTGASLSFSTYLGGGWGEAGNDIAVSRYGNVYVTGYTTSDNFPTTDNVHQRQLRGNQDGFVTGFNLSGSSLVYSTYVGGEGHDVANGLAVDSAGEVFLTGYTSSANFLGDGFPGRWGWDSTNDGGWDAFVMNLMLDGTMYYFSYLGGSADDYGTDIAVDRSNNAYVTGYARSPEFPTHNGWDRTCADGPPGCHDAFVAKFNATGFALVYSSFIGGGYDDTGTAIAVDAGGRVYVAGWTLSPDFPQLKQLRSFDCDDLRCSEAFLAVLQPSGAELALSTLFGGGNWDYLYGMAIDKDRQIAYMTGVTESTDFPLRNPVPNSRGADRDAFVTKIDLDFTGPYMTYPPVESFVTPSQLGTTDVPVRIAWRAHDDPGGSGVARYEVTRSVNNGPRIPVALTYPHSTNATVMLTPAQPSEWSGLHQFYARAQDRDGNWGDWRSSATMSLYVHPESASTVTYAGTWTGGVNSSFYGRGIRYSGALGARASFRFSGRHVAWVSTKANNRGRAAIYLDGAYVTTVDLYSATTQFRQVVFSRAVTQGSHTLDVRVLGERNPSSTNTYVDVDGFLHAG